MAKSEKGKRKKPAAECMGGVGRKPCQKETGKSDFFWAPLLKPSRRSGSNKFVGPPGEKGREEEEFRVASWSPTNFGRTDSCGAFVAMAYKWH